MGFRYRKSINFGLFRVNASKSGLGWSVGVPGARYTKMANGRTRKTLSIPGTGMSWVEESKKSSFEPKTIRPKPDGWRWYWHGLQDAMCAIIWAAIAVLGVLALVLAAILKK